MEVLTADSLSTAIRNCAGYRHLSVDESGYLAEHILNFFGYSDRIIYNVLHPEDRDTFYMLEDAGLMETEREETTLYDGREWRIHYWLLRHPEIFDRRNSGPQAVPEEVEPSVYDGIPDDLWSREGPEAEDEE